MRSRFWRRLPLVLILLLSFSPMQRLFAATAPGPDLYVLNAYADNILHYSGATGAFVGALSAPKLLVPAGIAAGPDGNLYVAEDAYGEVLRFNASTGTFKDVFTPNNGSLVRPQSLAFGPDGNLYVGDGYDNSVRRFSVATGAFMGIFVPAGSGGLNGPLSLAFGPDGSLYVASVGTSSVLRFSGTTGAFTGTFVAPGSGGLSGLTCIAFGPDGSLYAAMGSLSVSNAGILRYDGKTGAFLNAFVPPGSGGLSVNDAPQITFGPDGNLYAGQSYSTTIVRFNGATGAPLGMFTPTGSGGLQGVIGLAFGPALAPAASQTTLNSSLNPSLLGSKVTFTASVSGTGGTPTGTVTFSVDGAMQASIPLNSNLSTAFSTSSLSVGPHNITAAYSGDSRFAPSAAKLAQTVNPHISPQYVSPAGSDSNPGTQAAPKLTVQAAINATLNGDTVVIEDGTYTGPGNVDLDFGGRNIMVTSQNGAAATIIDCQGSTSANHRGFFLHSGETSPVISGLTIQNGYGSFYGTSSIYGGGIYDASMGLTVNNCIFRNNTAVDGGGIYSYEYRGTLTLTNCVFTGNSAATGGGIYSGTNPITIINCTVTGNMASSAATIPGGGLYYTGFSNANYPNGTGPVILTNDIFYGDSGGEVGNNGNGAPSAVATTCDIQNGYAGTGNISADPQFVLPPFMGALPDLHLQYGSPCIGAGTASGAPAATIDGMTRPNPPSIGAYEVAQTSTATALASSLNPSAAGQNVTLTATVTGTSGTPTGTVIFTVDGAVQPSATLSSGTAAFSTASLASGSHSITAAYSGDQFNAASTSAVLTQTVNSAASSTIVNDTSSGLTYAGTSWGYYSGRGVGDYQDDVHATSNNGDSVSYTFTGTSIAYLTETAPDEGSVQVYLDGTLQATVNAYSAARQVQQVLWSTTGLAAGTHTLKLVKAGGSYMLLDALAFTPAAVTATTVNDTSSSVAYTGASWGYYSSRGVGDYQDDVHAASANGDYLTFSFTGTSISYLTETNSDEGTVDVYLDGVLQTTVNAYSATRQVQQALWSTSGLSSGSHTLKLVKMGGNYMLLDAFMATPASSVSATTVNDTSSSITYAGAGWGYYPNRGVGDVNDDVHATTTAGDSASYTFTGTSISYITEANSDEGTVDVYMDGVFQQTVNCQSAARQVDRSVYSVSGLASGPHTIRLVKTGGNYMLVDAFSFQ